MQSLLLQLWLLHSTFLALSFSCFLSTNFYLLLSSSELHSSCSRRDHCSICNLLQPLIGFITILPSTRLHGNSLNMSYATMFGILHCSAVTVGLKFWPMCHHHLGHARNIIGQTRPHNIYYMITASAINLHVLNCIANNTYTDNLWKLLCNLMEGRIVRKPMRGWRRLQMLQWSLREQRLRSSEEDSRM